jgi:uncharacterized protein YndB with AHSA1/START domain
VSRADDEPATLRIERTFNAPAGKVFAAWTSVEVMRRWWHADHTWETPIAQVDPRVGGRLRLVMRNPVDATEYAGGGEYTIVDPPRRLAFTWNWEYEPSPPQLVDLQFIDHGDRTTVVMTNTGLPEMETNGYRQGWQNAFDNLDAALAE